MRHICAWCKRETAPPDGTADDDLISHGICEDCKELVLKEVTDIRDRRSEVRRDEYRTPARHVRHRAGRSNAQHRTSNERTREI